MVDIFPLRRSHSDDRMMDPSRKTDKMSKHICDGHAPVQMMDCANKCDDMCYCIRNNSGTMHHGGFVPNFVTGVLFY